MTKPPRIKISIRAKLLLASLSLLIIPWLGYQYVQALEAYLRAEQEQRLLDRVAVIASVMDGQKTLFTPLSSVSQSPISAAHIYVRPLNSPIQLDGYNDDWLIYNERKRALGAAKGDDLQVEYQMGRWQDYLYIFFHIKDDNVVYRQPNSLDPGKSDHLRIGFIDRQGVFKRYRLTTISPGWVNAYLMPNNPRQRLPLRSEFRIKGEWQEVAGGYNLEIRIPIDFIADKFSIALADVDDRQSRKVETIIASADTEMSTGLGSIVIPTLQMESLLQRLQKPQSRIWVLDKAQRVIGLADQLKQPATTASNTHEAPSVISGLTRLFYQFVLRQPSQLVHDKLSSASQLDDPAVVMALSGTPQVRWRQTADESISVITAAHPIHIDKKIVGAVAIEETSNSILILQNRVIEALVNMSTLVFVFTITVLLGFAARLSLRVRRLRNEVDSSIGTDGRIEKTIHASKASDELGDLSRSFYQMHQRISQYNRYLESMASKLSHELRTPISIVRSSLENLEQCQSPDEQATAEQQRYIQRANEGLQRLSGILSRMSEATRLEQTIQHEELTSFDVDGFIATCVETYRLAYPQQEFSYQQGSNNTQLNGSPELLSQLLDKLVSNAVDFAKPDTAITITTKRQDKHYLISVANEGPILPTEMRSNLFDSMVSLRQGQAIKKDAPDQIHLGLGLYMARLIAEHHHGGITIRNLAQDRGVVFEVNLPLP